MEHSSNDNHLYRLSTVYSIKNQKAPSKIYRMDKRSWKRYRKSQYYTVNPGINSRCIKPEDWSRWNWMDEHRSERNNMNRWPLLAERKERRRLPCHRKRIRVRVYYPIRTWSGRLLMLHYDRIFMLYYDPNPLELSNGS